MLLSEHVPAADTTPPSPIRFGTFEVDIAARELRKHGLKVKLQQQPFDVLLLLLDSPGQVVTRDTLQKKIWPADTFVDFDRGLNKAINRIREALGDLAGTPRFIETMPRLGYRFIAPIGERPSGAGVCSQPQRLVRSSLLPPPNTSFLPNHFALSPDGTRLAFVAANPDGSLGLWVRDLSAAGAQQLNGAEGASRPFWSPDSRRIGFFARGKLNTIDIAGGAVRFLCDARVAMGGAWHSEDIIVFAGHVTGPLYRVGASGGTPVPVTPMPEEHSSQLHCWPVFLPGTDRFLYFVNMTGPGDALCNGIHAGSLSSTEARLISAELDGNVGFANGHIVFANGGALKAQAFDPELLQLTSQPVTIAQNDIEIWERAWYHSGFSVSESGVVFQSCTDFAPELVWTDAAGNEIGRIRQRGYREPAISPNGRFVAISSDDYRDGRWYVSIHDVERGVTARLSEGGHDWHPSWSPDGKRILYDSTEGHMSCTYEIAADGSGCPHLLLERGSIIAHTSPDGPIVFMRIDGGRPMLVVHAPGDGQTMMLGLGAEPQFSPDGKWLAFSEPGGAGIVVRPFPGPGPRLQISSGPAAQARWSRDGTQLFYIAPDKKLMAVSFDAETGRAGAPRQLFQTRIIATSLGGFQYDVAPDGRFLINSLPSGASPLTLLTGWTAALKA